MQKLITLTALFIAGRWLQPSVEVPLGVPGFDYAKAFRKGMLEAEDGSEVLNPEAETALPTMSSLAEPSSDEATLRTKAAQLTRERDEVTRKVSNLQGELNTTRNALSAAQTQLQQTQDALKAWEGLDAAQVKTDLAALTEYRETLGELLPSSFPARKTLFDHGYYTLGILEGVDKATLTGLEGVGDKTADAILAVLPVAETPEG